MALLAYRLKHLNPSVFLQENEKPAIKNLKFMHKGQTYLDPASVYLGVPDDFPDGFKCHGGKNMVCVGGDEALYEKGKAQSLNLIVFNGKNTINFIANEIQNIFTFYNDWDDELQESLIKLKGVQHIIDMSYKVLNNPMYLIDPSFRTLSYSRNVSPDAIDDLWKSIVLNGHTDLATVNAMKENNILSWLNSLREPTINSSPIFTHRRINANIMYGKEKMGTLIVIEKETELEQAHLHLAEHMVSVILLALQKDIVYQNTRGTIYNHFIADLLAGKTLKKSQIEQQLKFLDWSVSDNFFLVKVKIGEHDLINDTLNYISHRLETIFRNSRSIIYQKHIVLIINAGKKDKLHEESIDQLCSFLKISKIKAAISSCFNDFSELQEYYQQTSATLELSDIQKKESYLLKYEDYVIEHLFMTASHNMDIRKICHPALLRLLTYDQQNKTNYYTDLRVFVRNHKNLVNSAKELFIHRNTFVYRINKIMKILDLDFSDENTEIHLILSYKLLDYLKESADRGG